MNYLKITLGLFFLTTLNVFGQESKSLLSVPSLHSLDWVIIFIFFIINLSIALYFSKKARENTTEYFAAGRTVSWWVAGTSIVATSFAADTPLVISGWMRTVGLERNWFWWGGIMGMMLCTFFFARQWNRSKLLTDVSFNELRYKGKPAIALRTFHASYRATIQNIVIMGFVTLAMSKIIDVTVNVPSFVFIQDQLWPILVPRGMDISSFVGGDIQNWPIYGSAILSAKALGITFCLFFALGYTTIAGLKGVMVGDVIQFSFAMIISFILMIFVYVKAGGPQMMIKKATEAVNEGRVVNAKPVVRHFIDKTVLLEKLSEQDLSKLVELNVFKIGNEGLNIYWNLNGVSEKLVESIFKKSEIENTEYLLEIWKEDYTLSESLFTNFNVVEKLVDHGYLLLDNNENGEPNDYFRLAQVGHNIDKLRSELGNHGINEKGEFIAAIRGHKVVIPSKITGFLPPFDIKGGGLLAVWALVVFLGLQWWAGGEGGGFLCQRLFSCKNERHSVLAMLWFNFAHFVIRPWLWIVVGIGSLFLIPDVTAYNPEYNQDHSYVLLFMEVLPTGLKGLMLAALAAAYISTMSTHINWAASYLITDIYSRFINKEASDKKQVKMSQIASIALGLFAGIYAFNAENIDSGWFIIFELMSGTGLVILARWYWWRVNAWSEISAMTASLTMFALLEWTHFFHIIFSAVGAPDYLVSEYPVRFTLNLFCSTVTWVIVTLLTPPEKDEVLIRFYKRVHPGGWWKDIPERAGNPDHVVFHWHDWGCWALGVAGLFLSIFCLGKLSMGFYLESAVTAVFALASIIGMFKLMGKIDWSDAIIDHSDHSDLTQKVK